MQSAKSIVWLRNDFRLADNPALAAAAQFEQVYMIYIHEDQSNDDWPIGAASRWWLHRSLQSLDRKVSKLGGNLAIAQGAAEEILPHLATSLGVTHIFWNRRYEKSAIERDALVKKALENLGFCVKSFAGRYLLEPWELKNQTGKPYKVFTPFAKAFLNFDVRLPTLTKIKKLSSLPASIKNLDIDSLNLLPRLTWYHSLERYWQPGEDAAKKALERFTDEIHDYVKDRDFPALAATSRLSAHLHFGEISPHRVWHKLSALEIKQSHIDSFPFLRQLLWREFANYSLFHFPEMPYEPLRSEFKRFPWSNKSLHLRAWQKGQTGYPIVDAGMRELWATGWMHNRVRMIVGSFLVKNLRIHWLEGEKWFWDTLVDADIANNSMGWQWVAGSGIDAAPYFRIFNPSLQSAKFDPQGSYIRRWVPELACLPNKWLHQPDKAPQKLLQDIGLTIGKGYPKPIIDYRISRQDALDSYQTLK